MSITYSTYKDVKALDAAIADAVAASHQVRETIQRVAVGILLHAHKHGDYTRAASFVKQLGAGVRQKALVEWFQQYGGLIAGKNAAGEEDFVAWQGAEFIKAHIDNAKSTMWWNCKPEPAFTGFDLNKEFERLVARAEKAMAEREKLAKAGKDEDAAKVVVDVDALTRLKAAIAAKVA
ncbi:hypothetical protein [Pantoea phage LIMEzero]|uniref:Uncharacterized protein n=1 Tax=Pantoea phage LIMEzero TaxID=943335 RepID=F4N9Q5_9CAUD|nr:hypothetical protein LIMEzero_ORF02 [Pantoea phage LIMEzero]CBY88533.1 hypothetical protein [Pantoea phage LIMEzero]